jgi:putative ABC transport system substrate-binding protein
MKKGTFTLFILATLILALVYPAHAQKQATTPRIGVLYLGAPHSNHNFVVFVQRLRELGYIEGKNILIEYRYAEGKEDRLPELATEPIRMFFPSM